MSSPYKTAAVHTLGCKVNFTETSMISQKFQKHGISVVPFDEIADIYVINTCSVTENANEKCDRIVRSLKRKNPDAYIAVTGCYAQLKSNELSKNNMIDLVVGTEYKMDVPNIILDEYGTRLNKTSNIEDVKNFSISYSSKDRVRSFLKVQDGCDYSCTFCTIPLARGKSRSSSIEDVINTVNSISEKGFNEIVLSGINLGDYGAGADYNFLELIKALNNETTIPRIRISSIEPNLLSSEIVDCLSASSRFMPHLHVPMQSGVDRILNLMQRRYTKSFYLDKIKELKNKIPDVCIGVDVIAGFPTETEEEFKETYDFLLELQVSYLHVFTYSERDDTIGKNIKPQVPYKVRLSRSRELRQLSSYLKNRFIKLNLNKIHSVLVEGDDIDSVYGYSENYIKVKFDKKNININDLVKVRANNQIDETLRGIVTT